MFWSLILLISLVVKIIKGKENKAERASEKGGEKKNKSNSIRVELFKTIPNVTNGSEHPFK